MPRESRREGARPRPSPLRVYRPRSAAVRPTTAILLSPRLQIDHEVAVERIGDSKQSVDPRRAAATLEARDRRLRRPDDLGQFPLGEALSLPALGDLVCNRGEEPAAVGR